MRILVYLISGLICYVFYLVHKKRMDKALQDKIPDDECVSCGSKNVTKLAPHVYRCEDCGYEGGSGAAAFNEQNRND